MTSLLSPAVAGLILYIPTLLPTLSYSVYSDIRYSVLLLLGLTTSNAVPNTLLFLSLTCTNFPDNTVASFLSMNTFPSALV